jgi:hypothetical protein
MSGRGAFNELAERVVENGFTVTPTIATPAYRSQIYPSLVVTGLYMLRQG